MHHSARINTQQVHATCYLDESATDAPSPAAPIAVVGGLALNKTYYRALNNRWSRMIDKFNLHPALHMKDFGQHGRFGTFSETERRRVFAAAAKAITECNIYTLAFTLEHSAYRAVFPQDFPKLMSQYAFCFLGCVLGNHTIAQANNYQKPVALVVDAGNKYRDQVFDAHGALYDAQKQGGRDLGLGSLTFENDEKVSALQAADVVCWAVRRRISGYSFKGGFEPLLDILKQPGHNESPMPEQSLRAIRDTIKTNHPQVSV